MSCISKTFCCLLVFLVLIGRSTFGQYTKSWRGDSTTINTKHLTINFSSIGQLKSVENFEHTKQGMQAADRTKKAVLTSNEIDNPILRAEPFLAVGSRLVFGQYQENFENIRLEFRSSTDGSQWSEWSLIDKEDHLTTSQDTLVGTLIYLPKETETLQFRIKLSSSSDMQGPRLQSLDLSFTSPGATPEEKLQEIRRKAVGHRRPGKQAEKEYPMPEYVRRTEWDCPDGQQPSGPVSPTTVTHHIVHHSAGSNSSSDWPAVVRSIWEYHVNTNGWSDIGYNWLVDPNGVIYQGRGWIDGNDEVQGAHFCGTNSNTMGVCVMGNFEQKTPTSDAQGSLEELLAWKSDANNIDPITWEYHASSGLNLFTVSGHLDGCNTLCPGENLYIRLPEIRENVKEKIGDPVAVNQNIVMENNYPNPFSEKTTILFSNGTPGLVHITIWDAAGRMVEEISNQFYDADTHSVSWNASGYAAGVYFCEINFQGYSAVQKMVLIK